MPPPGTIVLIAGPTAAGKSAVALRLAERRNGEIISVDSMQVYRGLDIGTAKPDPLERARIPHHLVDVASLRETFDAARFAAAADSAVREIAGRGRLPIFCGGTGLYFRAWLEGLGEAPPADPALRAQLEAAPMVELLRELAGSDPVAYERIDRQNPRRVVRAVEVIRLTGRPYSALRADWKSAGGAQRPGLLQFGLHRAPQDLRQRINSRVDEMFARGLVEECRQLLPAGLESNRVAGQALGYRQVLDHLRGERSLAETIELVKIRTWQFARRQMNWWRRQARLEWISWPAELTAEAVAAQISAQIEARRGAE